MQRRILAVAILLLLATACAAGNVALATDKDNGGTVTLHRGQELKVALSSTYWQFQSTSDPSVLRSSGQPVGHSSGGCVPGAGCGTVTATFRAVGTGRTTVTATRSSCGEALRCTGESGLFSLHVVVQS